MGMVNLRPAEEVNGVSPVSGWNASVANSSTVIPWMNFERVRSVQRAMIVYLMSGSISVMERRYGCGDWSTVTQISVGHTGIGIATALGVRIFFERWCLDFRLWWDVVSPHGMRLLGHMSLGQSFEANWVIIYIYITIRLVDYIVMILVAWLLCPFSIEPGKSFCCCCCWYEILKYLVEKIGEYYWLKTFTNVTHQRVFCF